MSQPERSRLEGLEGVEGLRAQSPQLAPEGVTDGHGWTQILKAVGTDKQPKLEKIKCKDA